MPEAQSHSRRFRTLGHARAFLMVNKIGYKLEVVVAMKIMYFSFD